MNIDRLNYRFWEHEVWNDPKTPLVPVYCNIVSGCDPTVAVGDFEFCTGLKDKNGNLIYEGDIINPGPAFGEDEVLIMWEDESFECHDIKTREFYYKLSSVARFGQCEIIGNIHQQK